ncbi:hypothetical protein BH23GEM6_BH23GEM6_19030 [soil metagenome]
MVRSRKVRAAGNGLRLLLFVVATYAALRFLLASVSSDGWGPAALFGVLLVAGASSLVWRSLADLRKSIQRLRS